MISPPAQEEVLIVDEDDRPVGTAPRWRMRRDRLIHRASYILVFNRGGELFVQKRTATKDIFPGYFDIAAGGVVLAGESYEQAARRELAEEMGVAAELVPHFTNYYADGGNRVWGKIFSCVHDGPFRLQPEEVESGCFIPLAAIEAMAATHPFTPDGLIVLRRYLALPDRGRPGSRP
ncbi:MAG: NUDIX hydrolase YfcD [Thermodesulfobacteriota bacterium]